MIFFSHGEMNYRNLVHQRFMSVKPFQVRHPNSPTKPPPHDIPNLFFFGEIVFRIRVVMLRGLIGRMDPIQSSCTLCVPSKRLGS